MRIFTLELGERTQALRQHLEGLRTAEPISSKRERANRIFHTVQTLEGAAQSVRLPVLARSCRAVRLVVTEVQQGEMRLDDSLLTLLAAFADALAEAFERLVAGATLEGAKMEQLLPELEVSARNPAPSKRRNGKISFMLRAIRSVT